MTEYDRYGYIYHENGSKLSKTCSTAGKFHLLAEGNNIKRDARG